VQGVRCQSKEISSILLHDASEGVGQIVLEKERVVLCNNDEESQSGKRAGREAEQTRRWEE
jgi:hypothetical protein